MKRITLLLALCITALTNGWSQQKWDEPQVPGKSLSTITSTETVYLYNVDTDAFLINGMTWNTNAAATRLANGDNKASNSQQCSVTVSGTTVKISLKNYPNLFVSCLSDAKNNIYVDQNQNAGFTFTETAAGSNVYTLKNLNYGSLLDVTWEYGGHLTITGGGGHSKWAFMPESDITSGKYMLYKAKKQLYNIYKAVADGNSSAYSTALDEAHAAYTAADATTTSVLEAARRLFELTYADIKGPIDVSFLFKQTDMSGEASVSEWMTGSGTYGWGEFERYHSALSMTQTQTVPQGVYDVMLHALYREDGQGSAPILKVDADNSVTATVPLIGSINYEVTNTESNGWAAGDISCVPNDMRSAAQALTHTDAVARAENITVGMGGKMTINISMTSAEQWLNWQGIRIIYKGIGSASLRETLATTISEAKALYGDGPRKGADKLKTAIDKAETVYNDENATQQAVIEANVMLKDAMETFRWEAASVDFPQELDNRISNASFEKGFEDWTQEGMAVQTNTSFALKAGNTYVEKWVSSGSNVGDASVKQQIKDLPMGVYLLKAAAQNIQQNNASVQHGAWITANISKTEVSGSADYTLVFTNIEKNATIGFEAVGATGNWLSVDNFRIYYAGGELADYQKELQLYIDNAKLYEGKKMQKSVSESLAKAINDAMAEAAKDNADGYTAVSTPLREIVDQAKVSIKAYTDLQQAINEAEAKYGDGSMAGAEAFKSVIDKAKETNNNLDATLQDIDEAIKSLEKAAFAYLLANPSGDVPTVKTDKRYARGAIAAFGRMSVTGVASGNLLEQGFCWSTEPKPTVLDNRTTKYLTNNGRIYVMDMEPATVYYMRAYAITKNYAVGYGDVIKMSTLPMGKVTYWYNNGGDASHNDRINTALTVATTYWSNYTSIRGFNVSCTFSPGTPTADCGYGGNMRIGTNQGQRAGTCMHEMNHGIGGGTLEIWGGWVKSPLRTHINGDWTGDRANDVVRFWENRDELVITAAYDGGHWGVVPKGETYSDANTYHNKYPHNGAHLEPGAWAGPQNANDTEIFYIGNALINQGFCEDGLVPVNYYSGGFCLPAYVFEQDDNKKYYIKSESEDNGLYSSYLTELPNGQVRWLAASAGEVTANDSAAWYVSFTPDNQYYQLRNAATGKYLSFYNNGTNGFRTTERATPGASEDFHVMRSRTDLMVGNKMTMRGYWLIHPEMKNNPATLTASANGITSAVALNLYDNATNQRWLFLGAEEVSEFESGVIANLRNKGNELINSWREVRHTSHTEDSEGADSEFDDALSTATLNLIGIQSEKEATLLINDLNKAGMTFLGKVTPSNSANPFNLSFLLDNAAINDSKGWSESINVTNSCGEFFETTFDLNQTITGLPAGTYKLTLQAFQRPGTSEEVSTQFANGTNSVNTFMFLGTKTKKVKNIMEGARNTRLHSEAVGVGSPVKYIPNSTASAAPYFTLKSYTNELFNEVANDNSSLRIGIRCGSSKTANWVCFDNFELLYYGSMTEATITSIDLPTVEDTSANGKAEIYTLQGVKVNTPMEQLPRGIYIVNKKKVIIR